MMKCCVPTCTNDSEGLPEDRGITFHAFPKDPDIRSLWIDALEILDWEVEGASTICSEHFKVEDFFETKGGLRKIRTGALPFVVENTPSDLNKPVGSKICRICMSMDVKLYHLKEHNLHKLYEKITGLRALSQSRLPQHICWECVSRLTSAVNLRDRAIRSQNLLQNIINCSTFIKLRDIKNLSRNEPLNSRLIRKIFVNNDYDLHISNDLDSDEVYHHSDEINDEMDDEFGLKIEVKDIETITEVEGDTITEEIKYEQIEHLEEVDESLLDGSKIVKHNDTFDDNNDFNDETDDRIEMEFIEDDTDVKEDVEMKYKIEYMEDNDSSQLKQESDIIYETEYINNDTGVNDDTVLYDDVDDEDFVITKTVHSKRKRRDVSGDNSKTKAIASRRLVLPFDQSFYNVRPLTFDEQIQEIERRKESSKYKKALYKCVVCYRGFQLEDRYVAHVYRHSEKSGNFQCFICKVRLSTNQSLRKHMSGQHKEEYTCKKCNFVTRHRGVASDHIKWHDGAKFTCPHCSKEFGKFTTYLGHIRLKHLSDCACEFCGYTFVSKNGIDIHKRKIHKDFDKDTPLLGPYCADCDIKFMNKDAYDVHLRISSKHSTEQDPNRVRNVFVLHSKPNLTGKRGRRPRREPDDEQPDPSKRVQCEQCGIELADMRLYTQHFRRVHGDKNRTMFSTMATCMCEQCGRVFKNMTQLKCHMWVHTGVKLFKCELCPKSFMNKFGLDFHMRVHENTNKLYPCAVCGKEFVFSSNRRRHMYTHMDIKPYKCDTCGKCFCTTFEKKAHTDHVHLKKPWPKRIRHRNNAKPDLVSDDEQV